ncbi:MAG: hypothetical protein ACM3PP_09340 [Candidatus Saccharibacteria bacterium]
MNRCAKWSAIILAFMLCLVITACSPAGSSQNQTGKANNKIEGNPASKVVDPNREVVDLGSQVLQAFKNSDMKVLSKCVHPSKGVRFTPYAHVDINKDKVFTREQVKNLDTDKTQFIWGAYDGSGEPIKLTPREYLKKFVYTADFLDAKQLSVNKILGTGNTLENQFEVYPNTKIVEYHFPQINPKYEGHDWQSLRLVFEKTSGEWYLVGVIHSQWTI